MSTNRFRFSEHLQKIPVSNKSFFFYLLFCLVFLIILVTFFYKDAHTQDNNCDLSGLVVDAATREPLPGANISLSPGERGTTSDLQGRFYLKHLKAGEYEISVSYIGYMVKKEKIHLASGQSLYLHIALLQQAIGLQEVTVSARRYQLY